MGGDSLTIDRTTLTDGVFTNVTTSVAVDTGTYSWDASAVPSGPVYQVRLTSN